MGNVQPLNILMNTVGSSYFELFGLEDEIFNAKRAALRRPFLLESNTRDLDCLVSLFSRSDSYSLLNW